MCLTHKATTLTFNSMTNPRYTIIATISTNAKRATLQVLPDKYLVLVLINFNMTLAN